MGEVWRATHRFLARPAAIKLIQPEMLGDVTQAPAQLLVQRFRREAHAAAMLRSPHTIQLYDFGVASDGTFYYVMELLNGMDLQTLVSEHGPLPPARAIHILAQVCESLAEAHERGLVHRDIKPANIQICRMGRECDFVKVLDFGLAKSEMPSMAEPGLTAPNIVAGTPAYLSPETALGEAVDHRTDVYSCGCVAYWMLTGRQVFQAQNAMQMIAHHIQTLRSGRQPAAPFSPFIAPDRDDARRRGEAFSHVTTIRNVPLDNSTAGPKGSCWYRKKFRSAGPRRNVTGILWVPERLYGIGDQLRVPMGTCLTPTDGSARRSVKPGSVKPPPSAQQ
jgi:serine/threonine protein kinase